MGQNMSSLRMSYNSLSYDLPYVRPAGMVAAPTIRPRGRTRTRAYEPITGLHSLTRFPII